MKKIAVFISCFIMLMITGCTNRPPGTKIAPITIALQEWVGYGPFYLAQEKGFCNEEGIELVFVDEKLDSARRDAFKRGMLDCEGGTVDLLVSKAAQDTPIVGVMEIDQSSGGDAIVVAENINRLEDLIGKRVALARDDVGETFISVLFYRKGLPLDQIMVVPKNPEEVAQAFLEGKADACVTWEPQVSAALKRPGAHILTSTREEPGIVIDTLNVRRDLIESHPGLVKKVMRVWFKSLAYYRAYPIEASEIIAKYYNITPGEYRKQIEGLKWDDYEVQKADTERREWFKAFDTIAEVKLADNRISQKPDIVKAINHSLMEKLYEDSK